MKRHIHLFLVLLFLAMGGFAQGSDLTIANDTSVSVSTTSVQVLPLNYQRQNVVITNMGLVTVYLCFGNTAAVPKGIPLDPSWVDSNGQPHAGGSFNGAGGYLFRGVINAITVSGTSTLSVHEGN